MINGQAVNKCPEQRRLFPWGERGTGRDGMTKLKTIYAYDPLEIEWDGTEVVEAVCLKCGRYCTQLVTDGMVHYNFCPWCGEEVKTDGLNQ